MSKILWAGQLSSLFGALILTLRHFYVMPAMNYPILVAILVIGFLPSIIAFYSFMKNLTDYIVVCNALLIVSSVYFLIEESALGGIFLLVPVLSLLFKKQKLYVISAISSMLVYLLLTGNYTTNAKVVLILDQMTIFLIMAFLIFLVVKELIQNTEVQTKQLQTVMSLSRSVEARDPYTKGHSDRVALLSQSIAAYIPEIDKRLIYQSGLIHDVGKLTTPDHILLKKGRLTDQEYFIMKKHTVEGASICRSLGISEELTKGVLYHHERWDGKGYPEGLKAEEIPIIARVLGIADAIDAMSSNRAYRNAMDFSRIREEIEKGQNTQFDPAIAQIVLQKWESFVRLLQKSHEEAHNNNNELLDVSAY